MMSNLEPMCNITNQQLDWSGQAGVAVFKFVSQTFYMFVFRENTMYGFVLREKHYIKSRKKRNQTELVTKS
jgi:hypothetical protein